MLAKDEERDTFGSTVVHRGTQLVLSAARKSESRGFRKDGRANRGILKVGSSQVSVFTACGSNNISLVSRDGSELCWPTTVGGSA